MKNRCRSAILVTSLLLANVAFAAPLTWDANGTATGQTSGNTFTHPQNANPAAGVSAAYRWSRDPTTFHGRGETDAAGRTVSFVGLTQAGITTVTATVSGMSAAKLFVDVKVTQN